MSERLFEDLARWERGRMHLDDVEARNPGQNVKGLVGIHMKLAAVATAGPVPDPSAGWAELSIRLPARPRVAPRANLVTLLAARSRRAALLAAALLLLAGSALALTLSDDLRHGVGRVWHGITSIFGGDEDAVGGSSAPPTSEGAGSSLSPSEVTEKAGGEGASGKPGGRANATTRSGGPRDGGEAKPTSQGQGVYPPKPGSSGSARGTGAGTTGDANGNAGGDGSGAGGTGAGRDDGTGTTGTDDGNDTGDGNGTGDGDGDQGDDGDDDGNGNGNGNGDDHDGDDDGDQGDDGDDGDDDQDDDGDDGDDQDDDGDDDQDDDDGDQDDDGDDDGDQDDDGDDDDGDDDDGDNGGGGDSVKAAVTRPGTSPRSASNLRARAT